MVTIDASCFGAVGAVPHAVATREAARVTTTRVSWRRDMGDSGSGNAFGNL